jgi:hypothetical protein
MKIQQKNKMKVPEKYDYKAIRWIMETLVTRSKNCETYGNMFKILKNKGGWMFEDGALP